MIEYIAIFLLSCIVLVWAGGKTVIALSRISRILKWKEFTVASLLMAIGSSLPEFFVGVVSGINQKPQLSFGNVLGSNIVALTLVIFIAALFLKTIKINREAIKKSVSLAVIYIVLPFLLILDGRLLRIDGVILIVSFIFYLRHFFLQQQKFKKPFDRFEKAPQEKLKIFFKELGFFLFSLVLFLLSAEGIIFSAGEICSAAHISLAIMGILGIALGTSLPEIIFTIRSIKMGHKEMVLGDALGSVMVNTGLVLGTTVLISPFEIKHTGLYLNSLIFSFLVAVLFWIFARTKNEINRKEGFILFFVYSLFVIIEAFIEAF
ncbi:sodium:calcium antiporter [bacterium]|nr:sodium:calcium antiporter [bacterium]